jgi:hypothetical protein
MSVLKVILLSFTPPSLTLEGGHEQVCGNAKAGKVVGPYSASSA